MKAGIKRHYLSGQHTTWTVCRNLNICTISQTGGKRDKRTAVALKRQGVKAGVPDICLPVERNGYHGLYIELKAGKNKATKSQEKWQKFLNSQGYYAVICYGWHEAAKVIEEYLLKADNDKAAAVLQEMESEE